MESGRAPTWARVEETGRYATCPACELFLPHEISQRDKRCPRCLRELGKAVLVRPVVVDTVVERGRAA